MQALAQIGNCSVNVPVLSVNLLQGPVLPGHVVVYDDPMLHPSFPLTGAIVSKKSICALMEFGGENWSSTWYVNVRVAPHPVVEFTGQVVSGVVVSVPVFSSELGR